MRRVWIVWACLVGSSLVRASTNLTDRPLAISAVSGMNADYGIFGLELSRMLGQHFEVHGGAGVGVSTIGGGGIRVFTFAEECFLLKWCTQRYFISSTFSRTFSSRVTVRSESGQSEFHIPRTSFVHVAMGDSTILFNRLNAGLSLGYMYSASRSEAEVVSSTEDEARVSAEKDSLDQSLRAGPQISISLGLVI